MRFIDELKRRNVIRVGGAYAVVGFVLIQAADVLFPILLLPDWSLRLVVVLTLMGFPVALVIAWAFELTPEGVKRTDPAPTKTHTTRRSTRPALVAAAAMTILALGGAGVVLTSRDNADAAHAELERSIAVLPFADMSANGDQAYFSDGITEDILTRLAQVPGLRVISRTSVMRYKGSDKGIPEIAAELGVSYILEGSVRREGNQVRITGQLIAAARDEHLWAESYDRDVTNVFAIQGEIAARIAEALEARLSREDRQRLESGGTGSVAAYELYLKAREQFALATSSTAEQRAAESLAMTFLRQALEEDPGYAPAWAALSRVHRWQLDSDPEERYDSAVAYARRAIVLDPALAEGYVELGAAYATRSQYEAAIEQYRYATDLNPNYAGAWSALSWIYHETGRYDEAIRHALRAVALDPADRQIYFRLAHAHAHLGLLDRGEEWIRRGYFEVAPHPAAGHCYLSNFSSFRGDPEGVRRHVEAMLAIEPEGSFARNCAFRRELRLGNYAAARTHLERYMAVEAEGEWRHPLEDMALLALKTGDPARADSLLELSEADARRDMAELPSWPYPYAVLAQIQALRGEPEAAVASLREGMARGYRAYQYIRTDPLLKTLHGRPDFEQLMTELQSELARQRERVLTGADG